MKTVPRDAHRAEAIRTKGLDYQMADLIGSAAGDRPTADRAHEAFGELLQQELRQKSRKPERRRHSTSRS